MLTKQMLKNVHYVTKSKTDSSKSYVITMIQNDDKLVLKCSCPSWRYNNNPNDPDHARVCKHIQQFLNEYVHPNTKRKLIHGTKLGLKA